MIFQSGRKNTVFGSAAEFAEVTLKISGITQKILYAVTDKNGRWEIEIPPFPPSFNAYTLEFSCGTEKISYDDVLFGELYHISG